MKRTITSLILILLICSSETLRAASVTNETFDSSSAGWISRSTNQLLVITHTNSGGNPGGAISVYLPQTMFIPQSDALVATGGLASAFVGDYTAAGIELLSFDIWAGSIVPEPNSLRVHLHSGTNYFMRLVHSFITSTGTWFGIRLPLHDAMLGGWTNVVGSFESFEAIQTNITRVEFEFRQSMLSEQRFLLDNVSLEALPRAQSIQESTNSLRIIWAPVRSGRTYRLEQADGEYEELSWSTVTMFTATGESHTIEFTPGSSNSMYRINW